MGLHNTVNVSPCLGTQSALPLPAVRGVRCVVELGEPEVSALRNSAPDHVSGTCGLFYHLGRVWRKHAGEMWDDDGLGERRARGRGTGWRAFSQWCLLGGDSVGVGGGERRGGEYISTVFCCTVL